MKNINKKSINLGFKILSILVFSFVFVPFNMASAAPTYVPGHYNVDGSYTFGDFVWNDSTSTDNKENPTPEIFSISPKSSNVDINTKTITITGAGFIPSSTVRINDISRVATFIDPAHLLVQITSGDTYAHQANGGFFITVYNSLPGGGYSNAAFYSVKNTNTSVSENNKKVGFFASIFGRNNKQETANNTNDDEKNRNLTANVIFGANSVLPSGLIQWILLGIIILIIVILTRKFFGATKNYHETPLKHA